MGWFDYLFMALGIIAALIILIYALLTRKFIKSLLILSAIGFTVLTLLHFTAPFTGLSLEYTPYSIAASCLFGMPGVVCMVICKMIFMI